MINDMGNREINKKCMKIVCFAFVAGGVATIFTLLGIIKVAIVFVFIAAILVFIAVGVRIFGSVDKNK